MSNLAVTDQAAVIETIGRETIGMGNKAGDIKNSLTQDHVLIRETIQEIRILTVHKETVSEQFVRNC